MVHELADRGSLAVNRAAGVLPLHADRHRLLKCKLQFKYKTFPTFARVDTRRYNYQQCMNDLTLNVRCVGHGDWSRKP